MLDDNEVIEVPINPYAIKSGLILSAISVAMTLVLYFSGMLMETWVTWIVMLIYALVVFSFQKRFRDQMQGGYIRYGKALGIGVVMYTVLGVIGSIVSYLLFSNDSSLTEKALEKTYEDMVEQGLPSSQIDMAMEMTEKMMTPGMMVLWGVVGTIIFGLIVSLITSAIVKRNHPLDVV